MSKRSCLFIICILWFQTGVAQTGENETVRDIIESMAENLADDYDLSELTARLGYYLEHPIDLNNTSPAALKELVFLSSLQISNFFTHLKLNGKLTDILELQAIDGFDLSTVNRLAPFIRVGAPLEISRLKLPDLYRMGRHDLMIRYGSILQKQKGFTDLPGSRYLGPPGKSLLRYKYDYNDLLSAALTAEKDAGEHFFKSKTGTDHLSFNITYHGSGAIKKLILGDYSLQFGQGLTLWSGFSFGKGPDVTSVASKDQGLRPYNSANEASFFQGAGSVIQINKHIDLTSFVSFRKLDASLKYTAGKDPTLQNINISGLHRTVTELKNQKSLAQWVYGTVVQYKGDNLNMGITGYQSNYEHEFVTGNQLYNKYAFTGKKLFNTGFHYDYALQNVYFFGELAHSIHSGWAVINGAMSSLSSKVSVVLLHRNYDRDYHNFFSNGIGEATEIANEKGIYTGINYMPTGKWTFSFYNDYFRFPWLKYRIDAASSGNELLAQVAYTPNKIFKVLARYKRETKQQNPTAGMVAGHLMRITKQNARLDWNWQANKRFAFHQRLEAVYSGPVNEYGILAFQDLDFKPVKNSFSGNIRIAWFNTSAYDSRIYAYEDDVLYGASSGIYSGKGIRAYLNLRIRVVKQMDIWTRYAIYIYSDKKSIGSGLDEIEGNKKSDFKVQMRYQF